MVAGAAARGDTVGVAAGTGQVVCVQARVVLGRGLQAGGAQVVGPFPCKIPPHSLSEGGGDDFMRKGDMCEE